MSDTLSFYTPYADISELAEAFSQRVDEERIMLAAAFLPTEGEWLRFAVSLRDGTAVLEGVGRVQQALDNGDAFPSAERYDIVLESLQFESRSQVVFERILLARETAFAQAKEQDADATLALDLPQEGGFAPVGTAEVESVPDEPIEAAAWSAESTGEVVLGDLHEMPTPIPTLIPSRRRGPPPLRPSVRASGLTRPTRAPSWSPQHPERPEPRPSTGVFPHEHDARARPAKPPSPDIAPELRVRPAVRA